MSEHEHDDHEPALSRRSWTALLGAAGAAALVGCVRGAEGAEGGERTATASAADTIAGALPSIAALRAHAALAGESYAVVQGYYQPDDGGGGVFYWSAGSAELDDGGTIIAPTAGGGRWKRVIARPGVLDLAWFGATPGAAAGLTNKAALTAALLRISAWGGGTLEVGRLYPLGDASDPSWLGVGIGMSAADGGVLTTPIHNLAIVGTVAGAGFQFVRATTAHTIAGLKLSGCQAVTLRGLTLDGNAQAIELVYLLRCTAARVVECTFQNALTSFSLEMTGGAHNRVERNYFGAGGGAKIGYIATAGDHEEGTHVVGNRFEGTGQMAGNRRAAVYVAIRSGVVSYNSFEGAAAGITILSDGIASEVCDSLAIVGNTFTGCDFGIRSDPTSSAGPAVPTRNLSILGNVIERAGGVTGNWAPGIGIYISNDLTISGNVLKDCDSAYAVALLSVTGAVVSGNVVDLTVPTAQILPQAPWGILFSIQSTETRDLCITGNLVGGYAAGIGGGTNTALVSNVTISDNIVTRLTGSSTLGFRVDPGTPGVALTGNRVDPGGTYDYVLLSSCRMANNTGKITTFNSSTFFEDDQGHHTFQPSASPPASPPAGVVLAAGDVVYNAAPATGAPVGWVWTGSAAGWRPFGTIG